MSATEITKADPASISNARSRQEWAAVINADWRKSIESIIQTGRDLIAAKSELPHGEFMVMIEQDLPFSVGAAEQLMRIAKHPVLGNSANSANLPSRWSTLLELADLTEWQITNAQEKGLITPATGVKAARAISGTYRKPEGETVGDPNKTNMLPSPKEAKDIARETGRFVAASDGNVYSGADEEQAEDYSRRRTEAFRVLEAINTLASAGNGYLIAKNMEPHWLQDFSTYSIEEAEQFLSQFCMGIGLRADLAMIDEDGADA